MLVDRHQPGHCTNQHEETCDRRVGEARRELPRNRSRSAELAEEFGVSRERVRQIEVNAFEKVQNAVKHRIAARATAAPLQVR
jgi:RNA polymerase sigma-32 factor